jgi:predicted GH43/DUF377 family glycosyl hydrolase
MAIYKIYSTVTVEVKDGRCRLSFTDPMYQYIGDTFGAVYTGVAVEGSVVTVEMANKVKEEWVKVATNFKASLATEASSW